MVPPSLLNNSERNLYGYNFWVEWKGIIHAGFQECSGLTATRNVIDYREGTDFSSGKRKLPGMNDYGNITLRRGITDNREMWEWHNLPQNGDGFKREVSIILADDQGDEKIRWTLQNCWPTSWNGPDFNSTSDEVAIETLELVHEGIIIESSR